MMFSESPFTPLVRLEINGMRYYVERNDKVQEPMPSVTTVIGCDPEKMAILANWRKAVGEKEANRKSAFASKRGTIIHDAMEEYMRHGTIRPIVRGGGNPLYYAGFMGLKKIADKHITNVKVVEEQMSSKHLRTAGTPDLIAEFDGQLSIIDWKTSGRRKELDEVAGYFIQESVYAVMYEELTGAPITNLVVVMVTDEAEVIVYKDKRDNWVNKFVELRNHFDELYPPIGTLKVEF
jgi:genome maintenance exonuclease 1